jgi:hypothetical protein
MVAPPLAGASVLAMTGVVDASCANAAPTHKVAAIDTATKYVLLMILFFLGQTNICTTMMKLLHSQPDGAMGRKFKKFAASNRTHVAVRHRIPELATRMPGPCRSTPRLRGLIKLLSRDLSRQLGLAVIASVQ